jgi:DNA-binding IclR family transcriptional regulator
MPNANDPPATRARSSPSTAQRGSEGPGLGPRRLGVSQLADQLGMTRPTVHGLLQTLQAHGFVEQDRDSDKYQLGAGLLHLGNSYLDLNELRARSLVHAERLATRAQAAVRVGVLHGPGRGRAPRLPPDAAFQVLEVGASCPPTPARSARRCSPTQPTPCSRADRRAAPQAHQPHADARPLRARSSRRARERLARERDEAVLGESSLAAPIHDSAGTPSEPSAWSATPSGSCPRPARGLGPAVTEAARSISRELGRRRWTGG